MPADKEVLQKLAQRKGKTAGEFVYLLGGGLVNGSAMFDGSNAYPQSYKHRIFNSVERMPLAVDWKNYHESIYSMW